MDKWQALHKFWSSFDIPAYRELRVPDLKDITYPYITYQAVSGGWDDEITGTASIYDNQSSLERIDGIADAIEHFVETTNGIDFDGGKLRYWKGSTPFAQDMGDPDDDRISHKVINVNFEFMQINI